MRCSHLLSELVERISTATLDELRLLRVEVWHEPEEVLAPAHRRLLFDLLAGRQRELLGRETPDP